MAIHAFDVASCLKAVAVIQQHVDAYWLSAQGIDGIDNDVIAKITHAVDVLEEHLESAKGIAAKEEAIANAYHIADKNDDPPVHDSCPPSYKEGNKKRNSATYRRDPFSERSNKTWRSHAKRIGRMATKKVIKNGSRRGEVEEVILPHKHETLRQNVCSSPKDCIRHSGTSFLGAQHWAIEIGQSFRPNHIRQRSIIHGLKRGTVDRPVYQTVQEEV